MSRHKFKVGQMVDYSPSRLDAPASSSAYKIIRLLPAEGGDRQYRIKSVAEPYERIARESQLKERQLTERPR
jgi:hypothetical protein